MSRLLLPLFSLLCCSLLASCTTTNSPDDEHANMCTALKQKLIFGGGTSDTRRADIQNASQPLQQANYDKSNC